MTSSSVPSARFQPRILPIIGEVLLSAVIVFGPLAFGSVEPWATAMLQGLVLLLGVVVAVHCLRSGEAPSMSVAALATIVALIGLLQAANVRQASGVRAGVVFSTSGFHSMRLAFMWACYAVLGASASVLLSRPAVRARFAWVVFLTGATIAFVGVVQMAQGNALYYGIRPIRNGNPFGPYTNYNHAASFMAAALCMGAGLFFAPLVADKRRPLGDQVPIQALTLAILALVFFGILETGSRAGLSAMVAGIGSFVGGWALLGRWRVRPVHKWLALLLTGAVTIGLFFNPGGHRFALSAMAQGATFRGAIYKSCLSAILDFPAFGIGLGAVPAAMHPYQTVWVGRLLESAHSDILDLLLQVGAAGAAAILFLMVKLAPKCLVECKMENSGAAMLRLGSLAACTVFLAHGLLESNLRIPSNAALIFALLAFASTPAAPGRSEMPLETPGFRYYSFGASAVVLTALLAVPFRAAQAAWVFQHALERSGDDTMELLQYAVSLDARPEYEYALALEYSNAADRASSNRTLLRRALRSSSSALESFPYHEPYRGLHALILSKLGRNRDAAAFPI